MKYLIYKGTGGIAHMLNGIQYAVQLSKKENRILIIDTKQLIAFNKKFCEYFFIYDKNLTYYTDYEQIDLNLNFNGIKISDLITKKAQLKGKKYFLENTNIQIEDQKDNEKNNIIRVFAGHSDCFIENMRLQNHILYDIFDNTHKIIEKHNRYISVHFRNTDLKNDIKQYIIKITKIYLIHKIKNVFIATDDHFAFKTFKKFLPQLNFFRFKEPQNFNGKNIHYHTENKDLLIKNTLADLYIIVKSTYFIPSLNSGLSKWLIFQKNHNEHRIFDDEYNFKVI